MTKINIELIKKLLIVLITGFFVLYCIYCFFITFFIIKIKGFSVLDKDYNDTSISWYYSDSYYYLFLPRGMNRERLLLNINLNYEKARIDCYDKFNEKITSIKDNKYTDVFLNDEIILKIKMKNKFTSTYKIKVVQSDINSLIIKTRHGDDSFNSIISDRWHNAYDHAKAFIYDLDGNESYYDIKKIKGRGNSTWLRPKKPFQLKMYDRDSMLGMNEANKWILLANHWDGSLSRNYIFYTLSKELNMDYSVDCSPVDLFVNNNYLGSYLLTNKIDIDNDNYLFEITNTMNYDIELKRGFKINIKNINFSRLSEDDGNKIKNDVISYLNKIESLIYDQNTTLDELSEYLDIDSFIKYYWVQEISLNYDVNRGSNYFYLKDNKIYMGPIWDMDNTLNRSYYYANLEEEYILNNTMLNNRISENWYQELFNKDGFREVVDNYFKDNVDVFDNLVNELKEYSKLIENSANMNYIRWSYKEMQEEQIRKWIVEDKDFKSSSNILINSLRKRIDYYKDFYNIN